MDTELIGQRCLKSELRFLFREGDALLSPAALSKTLKACALNPQAEDYSLEGVSKFAFARTMRVIEGWSYDEIQLCFETGQYSLEDRTYQSPQQIGERFYEEVMSRRSKVDLSREYRISLDTVSRTLWAIWIPTKRRLYSSEDCQSFADARTLLEGLELTYYQVRKYFTGSHNREEILKSFPQKQYSKRELASVFQLSVRTVKRTLRACGLSTEKRL